jgi:hypothetical protein
MSEFIRCRQSTFLLNDFSRLCLLLSAFDGRAIAEAVSSWLPTVAARVRARVWQVGFVVVKVASGQVFF